MHRQKEQVPIGIEAFIDSAIPCFALHTDTVDGRDVVCCGSGEERHDGRYLSYRIESHG
jgi:hypothetical protein